MKTQYVKHNGKFLKDASGQKLAYALFDGYDGTSEKMQKLAAKAVKDEPNREFLKNIGWTESELDELNI